jgi:hypothetical protein
MAQGAISFKNNRIQLNRPLSTLHPPPPYVFEDMLFDVMADSPMLVVTQSGTPTTAAARSASAGDPVAGYGGWLAGATDDVDAEIDEISLGDLGTGAGTPWMRADRVATRGGVMVVEWGLTVPTALTARQYFAGITDDPVEGTGTNGSLNIQSAYTIVDVANDAAGFIFSSLATAPTKWKKGATINGTESTCTAADDTLTQVADTFSSLRVEIDSGGNAFFSSRTVRGGPLTQYAHSSDEVITATVLMVPIFTAAPTTTTGVPWEIDYGFAAVSP